MATNLPEEMVYTITSGFYPQLFSSDAKWKKGKGRGRKGMQWVKKGGYSKKSISNVVTKMGGKDFGVMESGNSIVFDQAENRMHVQNAIMIMLSEKWK